MLDGLTAVWTEATIVAAVLAGLLAGVFPIGWAIARPRYLNARVSAREYGILVGLLGSVVGAAFWIGQLLAAVGIDHDPQAFRAASRYVLFLIFAPSMGFGTYLATRLSERRRARELRAIATRRVARDDREG